MSPIRIGTRKSKLALWQAEYVAGLLQKAGLHTTLIPMETKGDQVLNVSIAKIGSKGVFTEEIEAALAGNELDIAVHSAKDMQSILPKGFELIAFTKREYPGDVLVSRNPGASLAKPLTVGTSSVRRVALLRHRFPHIKIVDMRGNLQTRIRKMDEGACDALILAYAGAHRMGYDDLIREKLPLDYFVPAVGQGAIAIEASGRLPAEARKKIRDAVNDADTEVCLLAERAYLRKLEGGCSIPAFALSTLGSNTITLKAGIVDPEGRELFIRELSANRKMAESIGTQLGEEILHMGGAKILESIKKERETFHIRTAGKKDWPFLWEILCPVFREGETYPHAMDISEGDAFSYWMENPEATFLVHDARGGILGTYYMRPNQPGLGSHVCNCGFAVSQNFRGKGIARMMCTHAFEEARTRGYHAMQFNFVISTNTVAVNLWKKMGFDLVGVLPLAFHKKGEDYVDALVMFRSLLA